jgi:hypothetical protein
MTPFIRTECACRRASYAVPRASSPLMLATPLCAGVGTGVAAGEEGAAATAASA